MVTPDPTPAPFSAPAPVATRPRRRGVYGLALFAAIAAGLASRHLPAGWQASVGKYPGDALWALMVFFGLGALMPRVSSLRLAAGAFGFSVLIETLKLYQAPWAVAIRHTTLGHLVFGHVFSWQNLVAYAVGVLAGLTIELALSQRTRAARGQALH
jgi:hypothetical protein